jgi:hypothetical protein
MLNGYRTSNRKKATFFSCHHRNISASHIDVFGYIDVINLPIVLPQCNRFLLKRPVECIFFPEFMA